MAKNPRGQSRPQDGRGKGLGQQGGGRQGRNIGPCKSGGPGKGLGDGLGSGKNRRS